MPLISLISASNELPTANEGLEALWDRFLIRYYVKNIENVELFNKMITDTADIYEVNIPDGDKITPEMYKTFQKDIKAIKVDNMVLCSIHEIRVKLQEDLGITISDRRWKKIIKLLKTSAFMNNRNCVDLMDAFLIKHCIWNNETEIEQTEKIVREVVGGYGYTYDIKINDLIEELKRIKAEINKELKKSKDIHPHLKEHLAEKIQRLDEKISDSIHMVQEYLESDLGSLKNNMFIYDNYVPLVTTGIQDTISELEEMQMELDKKRDELGV